MTDHVLGCADLVRALGTSAEHLTLNRDVLNNLNVFPVPDGDTGSNMAATFGSAVKELKGFEPDSWRQVGEIMVPRMDNFSRGNSGFIISRFFKGFFSSLGESPLTVEKLGGGFSRGYFEAHTALFNPVEGTMISIISSMAEAVGGCRISSIIDCLDRAVAAARVTLFETPDMLPVLSRAGVVDSGALGFICIIEGILLGLKGGVPFQEEEGDYRFTPKRDAGIDEHEPLQGQFCTELTMKLDHDFPAGEIRDYLLQVGNSIALVNEDDFVKLHIHTDFPEQVIFKFEQYGIINERKVDDIYAQIGGEIRNGPAFQGCEVVPCVPGEGFKEIFNGFGVENVLVYGLNLPSVIDILTEVEKAEVDDIILLPNDRNILPACMAVKERCKKNISILPTGDIIQGVAAFYGFSENEDLETNTSSMNECMAMAESFVLHKSNADRSFGNQNIRKDDFFLLKGREILSSMTGFADTVMAGLGKTDITDRGNISFFFKDDIFCDDLKKLEKLIGVKYPHIEVEILFGGQARGELIISLE